MRNLQKFIKNNPSFYDSDSINLFCKPLEILGITYFSHVHIDHFNQMAAIATAAEFGYHYITEGYQNYDLHKLCLKHPNQIVIWDLIELKGQSKKMDLDFNSYGFGHTCTIIEKDEFGCNYFNFAAPYGTENINLVYLQNIDTLRQFISYFRDKISHEKNLRRVYQNRLLLDPNDGGYQTTNLIEEHSLDHFKQLTQPERIFINNQQYLTPSEHRCLMWISQGKTIPETAIILGIAERTVKAHVTSAKKKFNCRNLFQLGMLFSRIQS